MKAFSAARAHEVLTSLKEWGRVYVPVEEDGVIKYRPCWDSSDPLAAVRKGNSVLPPKDLFFPQTESIFRFTAAGKGLDIQAEELDRGPVVIFGVRPCDARSLELLDRVFLGDEFPETYYARRREESLVITWACSEADETCFCTSFECRPGYCSEGDLHITDLGDVLVVEEISEVGGRALDMIGGLLEDASGREDEVRRVQEEADALVKTEVSAAGLEKTLRDCFEHPIWEEYASSCLGCGICAYLCPTCHCYDLDGETRGQQGVRFRCWDSCMFSDFTRMAGGENPRPSRRERIRNRLLHKLQYYPERYGTHACVGCGRCLVHCPVHMDIVEFIEAIREVGLQ